MQVPPRKKSKALARGHKRHVRSEERLVGMEKRLAEAEEKFVELEEQRRKDDIADRKRQTKQFYIMAAISLITPIIAEVTAWILARLR